jgi:hypothetical protein
MRHASFSVRSRRCDKAGSIGAKQMDGMGVLSVMDRDGKMIAVERFSTALASRRMPIRKAVHQF